MVERCVLLLLATNSVDTVDPRVADEIRGIDNVIQAAIHRDSFERLQHSGLRLSDITKLLLRHEPHILHISGHAKPTEGLVLDDDNSNIAKVKCDQLVKLILSSADNARLRLVFFSFCYSEACATEILAKIPFAVGVTDEISADSLLHFSKAFYEALGPNKSVQGAFDNARAWLKTQSAEESNAMVLRVQRGKNAEAHFLSSMGFLKKVVDEASKPLLI